jgi:hypothetical protein
MKAIDVVSAETLAFFHKAAFEIIKDNLQEDIGVGATASLIRNNDKTDKKAQLVHTFCDGYHWGMSTTLALIEAGILNMQTLEIEDERP